MAKTAFVTGIAGQDGSYLSEYLKSLGYRVTGIVRRNSVVEHQKDRLSELLGIEFMYGDVLAYLKTSTDRYDIVWASGILYHQADPVAFLEAVCGRADHLFLHTHYFDAERVGEMNTSDRLRPKHDKQVSWHGRNKSAHHQLGV